MLGNRDSELFLKSKIHSPSSNCQKDHLDFLNSMAQHLSKTEKVEVIPPEFFKERSVSIRIEDQTQIQIISQNLENAGAFVMNQISSIADIILTDQPSHLILPPKLSTRGSRLVNSTIGPKIISIRQTPWVFAPPPLKEKQISKKNIKDFSDSLSGNRQIIIFDTTRVHQPIFGTIETPIQIYYGDTPEDYHLTPLVPLPKTSEAMDKTVKKSTAPKNPISFIVQDVHDNGFCEYCNMNFCSAAEHHKSRKHKESIAQFDMSQFDELAHELNMANYSLSEPVSL